MATLQLGPLALPLSPLLMLAGWWLAGWLADRRLRDGPPRVRRQAARALMLAAGAGLLASRAGFVALAWPEYTAGAGIVEDIVAMLNVRDGGWLPLAGAATAGGVLLACALRYRRSRVALAQGTLAGTAFWAAAVLLTGLHQRPVLPALTLPSLEGPEIALHAQQGHPMVINLWASWCAPCVEEMPVLAAAQRQHRDVRLVFVNQGETPQAVRAFLARETLRLDNVVLDPGSRLGPAVGSQALPTTLFVDAEGRVVERHIGPLSAASLAGRLRQLR
jgi:thiol-disulfide isomerase/thioredoxin